MRKDTVLSITIVGAVLCGIAFFAATKLPPAGISEPAASISLPEGGYTEHAPYYDIAANYATSTPLRGAANAAAIALMKGFVGDTITQFKADGNFANLTPADTKMRGFDQGRKETLQITYLIASSARTVSYIYTIYLDTLGAHGNIFFRTFTFDTVTGTSLSLADIFMPGSSYLDTLSSIARAQLPGNIGDSADTAMIDNGTVPEEKSFSKFFFDNRDFVILFAPYDVAAYAAGPQTLRIPLDDLSGALRPAYR